MCLDLYVFGKTVFEGFLTCGDLLAFLGGFLTRRFTCMVFLKFVLLFWGGLEPPTPLGVIGVLAVCKTLYTGLAYWQS